MAKLYAILFFAIVTAQFGMKIGVICYWSINRDMIATKLCINRNNKNSDCCGKCYLNTQLEKTENHQKDESKPDSKLKILEIDPAPITQNVYDYAPKDIFTIKALWRINPISLYKFHFSPICYHPP